MTTMPFIMKGYRAISAVIVFEFRMSLERGCTEAEVLG